MSGLIWIQYDKYSDCIPESIFWYKVDFEKKKSADDKKAWTYTQEAKS